MSRFHKLTIKDIHKEIDKAVTISFDVPEDLKDAFVFKAGQYITLKLRSMVTRWDVTIPYVRRQKVVSLKSP